jgi:hypothetical protein
MDFLDVLTKGKEGDPLDAFDEDEGTDLQLHVRQCGRRYKALKADMSVLKKMGLFCCIALVARYFGL